HVLQSRLRRRPQTRRVVVEEHFVAHRDLQVVLVRAGHVDAFDLPELALLLVHHRADDRAGNASGNRADGRAALGAVMTAVVADHGAHDRATDGADRGTFLRLVALGGDVTGIRRGADEQGDEHGCDELFHFFSSWIVGTG